MKEIILVGNKSTVILDNFYHAFPAVIKASSLSSFVDKSFDLEYCHFSLYFSYFFPFQMILCNSFIFTPFTITCHFNLFEETQKDACIATFIENR